MRAPARARRRSSAGARATASPRRSSAASSSRPVRPPLGELRTSGIAAARVALRRAVGRRRGPACTSSAATWRIAPARRAARRPAPATCCRPARCSSRRRPCRRTATSRASRRARASSTPTSPRAATRAPRSGITRDGRLLAVACDGRADDEAGLTLARAGRDARRARRRPGAQPRRRRLDLAGLRRAAAQRPARGPRRRAARRPAGRRRRSRSRRAESPASHGVTTAREAMRVLSGLMFFPRGGSAHVARALARELPAHGWDVTVVAGSLRAVAATPSASTPGSTSDAVRLRRAATRPMHPSYEDRPDAPDRVFAALDDDAYEAPRRRLVARAGGRRRRRRRRPAPAPPDADPRGGRARRARRPGRRPPARHRAAHARAHRRRRRPRLGPRRGVGAAHAPLGAALRAPAACSRTASSSAPSALLGIDPRPLRRSPPTASTPSASRRAPVDRARLLAPRPGRRAAAAGGPATTRARSRYRPRAGRRPWPAGPSCCPSGRFTEVKRLGLLVARLRPRARGAARARPRGLAGPRSAATRASGRASIPRRDRARPARATSSSPAGTTTTSCPSSSRPPTSSSSRPCASSSARCSSRGWPAACPPIAVDRFGPADIVDAGRDRLARRARRRGGAGRGATEALDDPGERARRAVAARADALARFCVAGARRTAGGDSSTSVARSGAGDAAAPRA